jgi:hypothetical protein
MSTTIKVHIRDVPDVVLVMTRLGHKYKRVVLPSGRYTGEVVVEFFTKQ